MSTRSKRIAPFTAFISLGGALPLLLWFGASMAGCGSATASVHVAVDGGGSAGSGGTTGTGANGSSAGGGSASGGSPSSQTVGALDGGPSTVLPPLPSLTNVRAVEREDSVGIDFDPVDDAVDYRVYPLPADKDVQINGDHSITIPNAIYRCAGLRQTFDLPNGADNPTGVVPDGGQAYFNPNPQYSWGATIPPNPTVGYVEVEPRDGLVPVYAVGVHASGYELGWQEARPKIYTPDATLRQTLVAAGGRDDGIVFYAPAQASSATQTVYHSETVVKSGQENQYSEYYFTAADMAAHASDMTPPSPAFQVFAAAASAASKPLMAVFYEPGQHHTELAVGKARFHRAAYQGAGPLWHVEWAPVTGPTTLVVEALASGCPFQGYLSPTSLSVPPHQPLLTLAQLQQASPTGEVYINGQYDLPGTTFTVLTGSGAMGGVWGVSDAGARQIRTSTASPVPVARSFVQVQPRPHDASQWDWYQGFAASSTLPDLVPSSDPAKCDCTVTDSKPCNGGDGACGYWTSSLFNVGGYEMDNPNRVPLFAYGQFGGQLWTVFDDVVQDVGSVIRLSVPQTATVDAATYLHVTWSVDIVGTNRRYPQLLLTDQGFPVEDTFSNPNSNTFIVQTIQGPSMRFEIEAIHGLVNGHPWAVNNQAPEHDFIDYDTWYLNPANASANIAPVISIFERAGMDRMTKFDAYVSSSRAYVFVDDTPAGCSLFPTTGGFALHGPVAVTFGDVIYHEASPDELICTPARPFAFMHEHQCSETKRHWDDLGFKSGAAAPQWDEARFPCRPY